MSDLSFSKVSLLLHGEGANGSTVFTDSSPRAKAISQVGGASISTVVAAFGTASIRNTANSYLLTPASTDFDFADGDFCIEMKVLFASSVSGKDIYFFDRHNVANGMRLELFGSALNFYTNATNIVSFNWAPVAGVQYHLALARVAGTVRCFIDGVVKATATYVGNINTGGSAIRIGNFGTTATFGLDGYIDEFRITKGDGRYSAAFAPPTAPFPDAGPLFYDTFTGADGVTLATHVSDSGRSYADAAGYENFTVPDGSGTYATRANLALAGNKLKATQRQAIEAVDGYDQWGGFAKIGGLNIPLDQLTVTFTVIAGQADETLSPYHMLTWPLNDGMSWWNNLAVSSAGYFVIWQLDSEYDLSTYNYNGEKLIWTPGSSHVLEFVIGDGLCVVKDNGVEVFSSPWKVLVRDQAEGVLEIDVFETVSVASLDTLQIDTNGLGPSPSADGSGGGGDTGPTPQTGDATGFSSTAYGTPTNRRTQPATGKPSSLAFGLATNRRTQGATGKPSGLSFGLPAASVAAASHVASGIPSATAFGVPKTARTQQATAVGAHAALGTPAASVAGGTLSGFVETFTGTANSALSAHTSDTGQTWNDPNGAYTLDSTGVRLLPCFNQGNRAGASGYTIPANPVATLQFQPPTTGTNPFQLIFGSGDPTTVSLNGALGLVYASGGNIQIRWFISPATSALIGQMTKAAFGFGVATVKVEIGKITVNGTEFADAQIAGLQAGSGVVLNLYSNTSTAAARPYLESFSVDVAPASNRTATATGLDSNISFGLAQAIPGQDVAATGIASTLTFGTPSGGYSSNTSVHPAGMPSAVTFGAPTFGTTLAALGFSGSVFGTPTTPTPRTLDSVGAVFATVGYPSARITKSVPRNRLLRAGTMRKTKIGYPRAI